MTERASIPFTTPHVAHTDVAPIDIFFGMTFVACSEGEHTPAVVTSIGKEGTNGFSSSTIIFDRNDQGLYVPDRISTSGTTWRDIIVTPGLSHLDRSLPDQLEIEEIYNGVLKGLSPHMVEAGSPRYLKGLQEDSRLGTKTVTKLTKRWSSPR